MSNTNDSNPQSASAPHRGSSGRWLLLLLVGAGGIYAGARWHQNVERVLGAAFGSALEHGDVHDPVGGAQEFWTCSMHPQVIQEKPGLCPICHMSLTPLKIDARSAKPSPEQAHHDHDSMQTATDASPPATDGGANSRKVKYWWDPMLSPPYISDKPGKSPMGMDLLPVFADDANESGNAVVIDPAVVQNMGVRVAKVTEGPLTKSLRLVGYLDEAQPNIREVNLRVSGWIKRLYANTEGMHVEAGDPLFDLYSPELQVGVEELIAARRATNALASEVDESTRATVRNLLDAASKKLELMGLDTAAIAALAKLDTAPESVVFTSPITGHVTEKPVVEGTAVKAGDRVLRIVDHSLLWLDAQVFEKDLPFIAIGEKAKATIASRSSEAVLGEVVFVHPHVNMDTRTALVRIAIPNPSLALKPGMYATVRIDAELADRAIRVPREAIIETGESELTFVVKAIGTFEPRTVKMGLSLDGGMVQVVEGLAPGDVVVTSGQFLLDSESRLREAIQKFLNEKQAKQAETMSMRDMAASESSSKRAEPNTEPAEAERTSRVDGVVTEYLALATALGVPQQDSTPLDVGKLVSAAHALHGAAAGTTFETLTVDVAKAAESMKGHPLDHQRELFKEVSDRVIALADRLAPSKKVGDKLFVMHCPMTGGNWLQVSDHLANPYYATDMKQCGSMERVIVAKGGG